MRSGRYGQCLDHEGLRGWLRTRDTWRTSPTCALWRGEVSDRSLHGDAFMQFQSKILHFLFQLSWSLAAVHLAQP